MKKEIPLSQAHRLINNGPVVLVTSQSKTGRSNVLAIAWATPVSQVPPLVAVSIAKGHYSHLLVSESREFVVNVPSPSMADKVMVCGRFSGRDVDKFEKAGLTPMQASVVRPPLVEECIGHLECRVERTVEAGDHSLFIGRVEKAWAEDGLFDEVWRCSEEDCGGLHHLGGNVFSISEKKVVVEDD
ncbi:MAG: flavin reductase family protein [bacterium]